ncbi:MAG: hypothetical protein KDA55_14770 [Planctomycetales bacterium]|nr:hypothetical protein [Planctomycetales bacterium]
MQRLNWNRIALFVALVAVGVLTRLCFRDLPNFAPVAAMALFAGYFFASRAVALCVPLLVMTISDTVIGGYDTRVMALVYGSLMMPVAWRSILRRWFRLDNERLAPTALAAGGLLACGLASSVMFFLITNFGVWTFSEMYSHDAVGLARCYTQALPFFRNTLIGDAFFAVMLFGGYATALRWLPAARHSSATESLPAEI